MEIRWPSGLVEKVDGVAMNKVNRITGGKGSRAVKFQWRGCGRGPARQDECLASAVGVLLLGFQAARRAQQDRLAQARNLGKAFYENPTTQIQAVDEFKKALDMVPDSARERVNYGSALLHAAKTAEGSPNSRGAEAGSEDSAYLVQPRHRLQEGFKYDQAIAEFEGMVKLVPNEPISHYNLGVLYKLNGKTDEALKNSSLVRS